MDAGPPPIRHSYPPSPPASEGGRFSMDIITGGARQEHRKPPNGAAHDAEEDEDDEVVELEEEEGLLGGQRRSAGTAEEGQQDGDVPEWKVAKELILETAPIVLFAMLGTLFAGELLEHVARWKAFSAVRELFILLPILTNLKGNLEMCLSSRLSTASHLGVLTRPLMLANLLLLQLQALAMSLLGGCIAFLLGLISPDDYTPPQKGGHKPKPGGPLDLGDVPALRAGTRILVLLSAAMGTACLASLVLGSFMCGLVAVCSKLGLDPDNIATPIAATLGDLLTVLLLGVLGTVLYRLTSTPLPLLALLGLCAALVGIAYASTRNKHLQPVLFQGWTPLLTAIAISSCAGLLLESFVQQYEGFGMLSLATGGLCGPVGSVYISRLSTELHVPPSRRPTRRRLTAPLTLAAIAVPVAAGFLVVTNVFGWLQTAVPFALAYLFTVALTASASLTLASGITRFFWSRSLDPDTYAFPIHAALVDATSQVLLVCLFGTLSALGADITISGKKNLELGTRGVGWG